MWKLRFLGVVAALCMVSVSAAGEPLRRGDINLLVEKYGVVLRDSKWHSNTIQVCWENIDDDFDQFRTLTRKAIEDTWEAYTPIRFAGWSKCETETDGIRISVADQGPHVKVLGRYLANRPDGMVLNFMFQATSCPYELEDCVKKTAVHEFGHALGLAHEHLREDAPQLCKDEVAGAIADIYGDLVLTKYDPKSIMNYCAKPWLGTGKLTEKDIEAIKKFYS